MIDIYVKKFERAWYGLAYTEERILATVVSSAKQEAVRNLQGSVPVGVEHRSVEEGSEFAEKTILMLKDLEQGKEEIKRFSLATEYISEPVARVLEIAAAIPIGYVTSYGNIAQTAGTAPRAVGRIMAMNPLYPIVPCHRVIGADFSLVGYGGRKNLQALQAKLARLSKEAKGFTKEKEVLTNGRKLRVYPVEYVIKRSEKHGPISSRQRSLCDCIKSSAL